MALELAFEETGSGPPVLVLHGLFGSATNWRSVARALAKSRRVFAVDLRNHGSSPWADSMGYSDMADDVLALIEGKGLQQPAVIGHSMGGKVAMVLALRHPGSVGQLVVVDIAPVRYEDRFSEYVLAMRNIDIASPASRSQVAKRLSTSIPDAGTVAFLMQNLVTRNDHFDWRLNLPAISGAMRELSSFPAELTGQRFDGPTTLIAGAHSDYVKPADRAVFSALFPRLEVVVIEGASHWVHADQPEAFIQAASAAIGALP